MFPADSGSGKSTLALALLSRGWKYFCDEFAMIDPETLCLHPFPKALCIKSGSFEIVHRSGLAFAAGRYHVHGYKGQVGYVNPLHFGSDVMAEPAPIRLIVLPKYTPGIAPRCRPTTPDQAAFALARHSPNRTAFGDRAIAVFTDIARKTDALALDVGPLEETCDLLEDLLSKIQ